MISEKLQTVKNDKLIEITCFYFSSFFFL